MQTSRSCLNTAKKAILHAIVNTGNEAQQMLALTNALLEPSMMNITKSVITHILSTNEWKEATKSTTNNHSNVTTISNGEESSTSNTDGEETGGVVPEIVGCPVLNNDVPSEMYEIIFQNVVDMLHSVKRSKRLHDNKERFLRILFTIIASKKLMTTFSTTKLGKAFGYYRKTIQKRLQQGLENRIKITKGINNAFDFPVSQKRKKKLSPAIENEIIQYVKQHEHVRQSPNMNDTLKINGELVGKLILEYLSMIF